MSGINKEQYMSLSALSARIASAIENGAGGEYWVTAEVSSVQVNYSGHCYLELTESNAGQQTPKAVCRAVIWSNRYRIISGYFRHTTGEDIKAGMKLLVRCAVSFHPVYSLSLVISDIDPSYTIGEVERVRKQTINQLNKDGVFDMNRELELPPVIQKIAVISSTTAAGYGDFCNELISSEFRFDVTLFPAVMQGQAAQESIIAALEEVAEHDFDTVVIIRGGGSTSDLVCFDSYELCFNLAQFPIPIITGIGHDRDVSVADMVARLSLKTPTAVAGYIIEQAVNFMDRLLKAEQYIANRAQQNLTEQSRRIENYSLHLESIVHQYINANTRRIDAAESALKFAASSILQRENQQVQNHRNSLQHAVRAITQHQYERCTTLEYQLRMLSVQTLATHRHRIDMLEISVDAANPRRILKMGYAIVNNGLRSVEQLSQGDVVTIELSDGIVNAKTEKICHKKTS